VKAANPSTFAAGALILMGISLVLLLGSGVVCLLHWIAEWGAG